MQVDTTRLSGHLAAASAPAFSIIDVHAGSMEFETINAMVCAGMTGTVVTSIRKVMNRPRFRRSVVVFVLFLFSKAECFFSNFSYLFFVFAVTKLLCPT